MRNTNYKALVLDPRALVFNLRDDRFEYSPRLPGITTPAEFDEWLQTHPHWGELDNLLDWTYALQECRDPARCQHRVDARREAAFFEAVAHWQQMKDQPRDYGPYGMHIWKAEWTNPGHPARGIYGEYAPPSGGRDDTPRGYYRLSDCDPETAETATETFEKERELAKTETYGQHMIRLAIEQVDAMQHDASVPHPRSDGQDEYHRTRTFHQEVIAMFVQRGAGVKLYFEEPSHFCIETIHTDPTEFLLDMAENLALLIEKQHIPATLNLCFMNVLPQIVEITNKLKGYKSEVQVEQIIRAGTLPPQKEQQVWPEPEKVAT
jgi:hypothetical protein